MQLVSSHEDGMDRTILGVWYTHFVAHDTTEQGILAVLWTCVAQHTLWSNEENRNLGGE